MPVFIGKALKNIEVGNIETISWIDVISFTKRRQVWKDEEYLLCNVAIPGSIPDTVWSPEHQGKPLGSIR